MEAPTLLKDWRTRRDLSQEDAAQKVDVHQNTWSDWESGKKVPRTPKALEIHVLTGGEVPVDAWCPDADLAKKWRAMMRRLLAA